MIAHCEIDRELRRRWRRQMTAHLDLHYVEARRGFAALTFVDNANISSPFVDINNLIALLLYEDVPSGTGRSPLRLCGYRIRCTPDGIRWGGTENGDCVLDKNLTLSPQFGGRGPRLDCRKCDLIDTALKLDRRLSAAARHSAAPWRELRLPRLWAGFRAQRAIALRGDGPEFEQACRSQSSAPDDLFNATARRIDGLVAYPLEWVAGELPSAVAVFAELTLSVRRQVCRIGELPGGLIGFQRAPYDFYSSCFRQRTRKSRLPRIRANGEAFDRQGKPRKPRTQEAACVVG
jgi:hypothetical protein